MEVDGVGTVEVDGVGSSEVKVVGVRSLEMDGLGVPGATFSSEKFEVVLHLKKEKEKRKVPFLVTAKVTIPYWSSTYFLCLMVSLIKLRIVNRGQVGTYIGPSLPLWPASFTC